MEQLPTPRAFGQSQRGHHRKPRLQPGLPAREQARNRLREAKFDATYQEWAKELRLRAYIELREPPV